MPERAVPNPLYPTPASAPFSSKRPFPRLTKRKLGTVSLPTNRSSQPSLLMSAATTPHAFARDLAIPDSLLTSVNVPSPLLWNNQEGAGVNGAGLQYARWFSTPRPHWRLVVLENSTKRQTK